MKCWTTRCLHNLTHLIRFTTAMGAPLPTLFLQRISASLGAGLCGGPQRGSVRFDLVLSTQNGSIHWHGLCCAGPASEA